MTKRLATRLVFGHETPYVDYCIRAIDFDFPSTSEGLRDSKHTENKRTHLILTLEKESGRFRHFAELVDKTRENTDITPYLRLVFQ